MKSLSINDIIILAVTFLSVLGVLILVRWIKGRKSAKAEKVSDLIEEGISIMSKPKDPDKKFFLRRINDYWVPVIFTGFFVVAQKLIVEFDGFLTLEAVAGIQAFLFRLFIASWTLPIIKTLMQIYFAVFDDYTSNEKIVDFDAITPRDRLWMYLSVVLVLFYSVVH